MKLVKTDGEITNLITKGKKPTLAEMQEAVGGPIEVILLNPSVMLIVNEEGIMRNLPVNMPATVLYQDLCHTSSVIVGNALLANKGEID